MGTDIDKGMLADMDPEERALLTGEPVDDAAKESAAAAEADTDLDDETPAGDEAEKDGAAEAAAAKAAATPNADDAAAALAEIEPTDKPEAAAKPDQPKTFEVAADDFDAKRKALQAERKAVIKQWGDGELTDDEYDAKLDELDGSIYTVIQQQAKQQTLAEINAQQAREAQAKQEQAENAVMVEVAKASKASNQIDYGADADACKAFDAAFNAAKADSKNAGLTLKQIAERAHRGVLAMRGIEPLAAAPAPAPAAAPAKPKPPAPPTTLGTMPAAAAQVVGDAFDETFDAIEDPDEREAKWASLSAAQRQQQLRRTVPTTRGRH